MAKKKAKTFPSKELLSLYNNGNYQKVISKTKQFDVEGITQNDLNHIICGSYQKLSYENFQNGDIQRAIRDVDSLLLINDKEEYRLLKLKYLLYIEYFTEAIQYAIPLLTSKIDAIKKETAFVYLLAKIYNKEYDLEAEYLKILPVSRKNYVLGFLEFYKDNIKKAIEYLDKANPRLKQEKLALNTLKSIILNEEISVEIDTKPLYNFLAWGNEKNLQSTKNSRIIKTEIVKQFNEKSKNKGIENLLALKHSTTPEIILEAVEDKVKQIKLIYNNIMILIEKRKNVDEALSQFLKYQDKLVTLVESVNLLYTLFHQENDYRVEQKLLPFFKKYLELHQNKLLDFQLEYLFYFILHTISVPDNMKVNIAYVELAKSYKMEHIIFITQHILSMHLLDVDKHKEYFEKILGSSSKFIGSIVKNSFDILNRTDTIILAQETRFIEDYKNKLYVIIKAFAQIKNPHKKNKKLILDVSQILANLLQTFKMSPQNQVIYAELVNIIEHYIEYYKITPAELAIDIKALFVAFSTKKDIKNLKNHNHYNDYKRMFFSMFDQEESKYDFDESDYDFIIYKKNFIKHLESGKNPIEALIGFALMGKNFYKNFLNIFRLLTLMHEKKTLTFNFLHELFLSMDININRDKEIFTKIIEEYAKIDLDTTVFVAQYILTLIKGINTVWAMNLIYVYLELFSKYPLNKDEEFQKNLELFYAIYSKGKFTSMRIKYNNIKKMFGEIAPKQKK